MSVPKKTGVRLCDQCAYVCKNEEYRLAHRFIDKKEDADLIFCGRECLMEYFEDELFFDKIEAAVTKAREAEESEIRAQKDFLKKEHHHLIKQVCPACVRRIRRLA